MRRGAWVALALVAALFASGGAGAQEGDEEGQPPKEPLVLRSYRVSWFDSARFDPRPALLEHAFDGLAADAACVWISEARLPARALLPRLPPHQDAVPSWDPVTLKELIEQRLSTLDEGSVQQVAPDTLMVYKPLAAQARVESFLDALAAAYRPCVSIDARVIALRTGDPALLSTDPAALAAGALERGRELLSGSRDASLSYRVTLDHVETRSVVVGRRPVCSGLSPSKAPYVEAVSSGVEVSMIPTIARGGRALRLSIEAGEATVEGVETVHALGTDLDLPTCCLRAVRTCMVIPRDGKAAIALGPRSASETAVLVLRAAWTPPYEGAPGVILVAPTAAPRGAEPSFRENPTAFIDTGAATYWSYADPEDGQHVSPDELQDIVKCATGGDAAWGDGTSIEWRRGRFLVTNTPAVISATAALIATLDELRFPRSLDAWALRASTPPSQTGPLSAAQAEALLARAARKDGVSLAARFGGGLAVGGVTRARSSTTTRFIGAIEDPPPLDAAEAATATAAERAGIPLPCEVDAGLSLEASLDADGDLRAGTLRLAATLVEQRADLSRTARASVEDPSALIRLPSLARREASGRVALPPEGGWALLAAPRGEGEDALLLLVRVGS